MDDLVDSLRGVKFLQGIGEERLRRLAAISRKVSFPAQHDIFHEDDPGKEVYFVVRGEVCLITCMPGVGCRQLMKVGPGELVGWSPLVGKAHLTDTARTLTATVAIAVDGEQVLALCAADPTFGFDFMYRAAKTLASRLSATRLQLLEMSGVRLPEVQIESD